MRQDKWHELRIGRGLFEAWMRVQQQERADVTYKCHSFPAFWAHLDTAARLAAGRCQNSQAGMPALRGASRPGCGLRGFPAPCCSRWLFHFAAVISKLYLHQGFGFYVIGILTAV